MQFHLSEGFMPIKHNSSLPVTATALGLSPRDNGAISAAIAPLMVIFINVASPRPALGQTCKDKNAERFAPCAPQRATVALADGALPPLLRLADRGEPGSAWRNVDVTPAPAHDAGEAANMSVWLRKLTERPRRLLRRIGATPELQALLAAFGLGQARPAPPLMREPIVGSASMYNPCDPGQSSGGAETASGELYDAEAWTAAIQIGLRARFGGVRYGSSYRHAYALVESEDKRAIVKINDVGPLAPGRVIDLNERAMRYFDPALEAGLVPNVRITPLAGGDWTPGPVADDSLIRPVAAGRDRPVREQLATNMD
jgi:rare lipoprotein A